jgi:replicative DNA helicase
MSATVPPQHTPAADESAPSAGFERIPPQDLDAEQSVLGGMMLSPGAIGDVLELPLETGDFYRPAHETVFRAILAVYERGEEQADPITVTAELTKRGEIAKVGGPGYVHRLVQTVPTAANTEYYAEIVAERAALRRLVEAGTRITQMGYAAEGELEEIRDAAGAELHNAMQVRDESATFRLGERTAALVDRLEARARGEVTKGVPTGFTDLDSLTGGLHAGQMIIVAGRPALGKSSLAVDFARSCAIKHRRPAALFSLEMGADELEERIASAEARVSLHHMSTGELGEDDWKCLSKALTRIDDAPLYIDDTPNATAMQIKAKCRRIQQRHGLDLVVIDYLQLMQSHGRRAESRQVEVAEMSRTIKLMAKELGVPVVILSQLNRGPEQRTDKKPVLSDLRESGGLEQDSDVVILLHREDAYEKESPRAGEADLIVAKHRNGPTATITVANQLHFSRFVDMVQT